MSSVNFFTGEHDKGASGKTTQIISGGPPEETPLTLEEANNILSGDTPMSTKKALQKLQKIAPEHVEQFQAESGFNIASIPHMEDLMKGDGDFLSQNFNLRDTLARVKALEGAQPEGQLPP